MRLPTKPSQTPTSTPTLPSFLDSFMTVAMVSGEVRAPRTFSISFMTLAGLKKCVPMTCSGRDVAAAMASTSRVDVLVARIASGLQTRSSRAKTSCFSGSSSNTASITTSAAPRSASSRVGVMRSSRSSICACDSRPFETVAA